MLDHFTHGAKLVSGMTFFYEVRGQLSKGRYEKRTRVMPQPQTQYQTKFMWMLKMRKLTSLKLYLLCNFGKACLPSTCILHEYC